MQVAFEDPIWALDLGSEHYLEFVRSAQSGALIGGLLWNRTDKTDTGWCVGSVFWENQGDSRPVWNLSGDLASGNFTLSPSILCHACGDHGFIRNGIWERA